MMLYSSTERDSPGQSNSDVEKNVMSASSSTSPADEPRAQKEAEENRWAPRDWQLNRGKARPFSGLFLNVDSASTTILQGNEATTHTAESFTATELHESVIAGSAPDPAGNLSSDLQESNMPTAEEALAEARRMVEEVDHNGDNGLGNGNVGVQWDEPPDFKPAGSGRDTCVNPSLPTAEDALAQARKMLDEADARGGEGNVGLQWDDPPLPPPPQHDARVQRSGVAVPSSRNVGGEGNVGLQWDDPPPPSNQNLSTASHVQHTALPNRTTSSSHAPMDTLQSTNGRDDVGGQWGDLPLFNAQQTLAAINPDVLLPGLDSSGFEGAGDTTFGLPPVVDVDGEQGDVGMLMGSKEGEIPQGMEWDPVGEMFVSEQERGEEDRDQVVGNAKAVVTQTNGGHEAATALEAENEVEEEAYAKPASFQKPKSEASGKERGLIDRIKRRLSKAKR